MLSRQGYKLKKDDLSEAQIKLIKKDLTARPAIVQGFGPPNQKPPEYPIYMESKTSYYLPRFYGKKHFGEPVTDNLDEGLSVNIEFKGSSLLYCDGIRDEEQFCWGPRRFRQ